MIQYTVRRVLYSIPVVFGVLLVTFFLVRAIPGDPCTAILGEKATPEICERFLREKGLDKPIPVQFGIYLKDVAQGNFGESIRFKRPITVMLLERLPVTLELGLMAVTFSVLIGVPLGIISALKRNSALDVGTMLGANIGVSMPVFWLGLMLAYIFALLLKDTPFALPPTGRLSAGMVPIPFYEIYGLEVADGDTAPTLLTFISNMYIVNALLGLQWEAFWDTFKHLILPAIALGTIPLAIIARMSRSSMLEVLGADYVRTARAKGLKYNKVVMKHAWRNALLPVVTIVGLQLGLVLSGAVLTETIFGLAGVGRAMFEAITARDFPVIQGFVVVIAIGFVALNLIVDLSYGFLDPRIRID